MLAQGTGIKAFLDRVSLDHALDPGLIVKSDEELLTLATTQQYELYTFNVCDFYRLHTPMGLMPGESMPD
jgi:hypothetical protein